MNTLDLLTMNGLELGIKQGGEVARAVVKDAIAEAKAIRAEAKAARTEAKIARAEAKTAKAEANVEMKDAKAKVKAKAKVTKAEAKAASAEAIALRTEARAVVAETIAERGLALAFEADKKHTVAKLLALSDFSNEQIAEIANTTIAFVKKARLSSNKK